MARWPNACRPGVRPYERRRGLGPQRRRAVNTGQEPPDIGDNSAMTITIKTPDDIEKMRIAGRLAAEVLQVVAPHVKPG